MLIIPEKFKTLINGIDDEISSSIGIATSAANPILLRNECPFFPDYTDHGLEHIQNVLNSCEALINDDSWREFSRSDAATLILSVIAHDLGMLLNVDNFFSLIDKTIYPDTKLITTDIPWNKLWNEYILDAGRFDGSTLINITGSPEPVRSIELRKENLTERGKKIIGEFIRRHHHRIAHEILVIGMPTTSSSFKLFENIPYYIRNIAGIISRSHGTSIRDCIDNLTEIDKNMHREHRNIHPTFLMTLIRLSDYLDLDSKRAPSSLLSVKSLKSPISKREWWAHKAIVDIHSYTDDPESLHVTIEPKEINSVIVLSTVSEKIVSIQKELDSSWAVLGEVYGRFPPLNRFSLKIRRIKSNADTPSLTSSLPFVPHKASLESARADLLNLLIEPLYGNHPGIGIRELLQNSIDAVREFEFYSDKENLDIENEREDIESDIVIYFENDSNNDEWIVIADRGIGMTWKTVSKYYLTAGASFRKSDAWKKNFTDDSGNSNIFRSGRFGIGALAGFLLGDKVSIKTRHINSEIDKGIELEFGLEDTSIEMRWTNKKIGTTIKIRSNKNVIDKLHNVIHSNHEIYNEERWDWYCLNNPIVTRKNNAGKTLKQEYNIPGPNDKLPSFVHRINVDGLQSAHWTYSNKFPMFTCNGIFISEYCLDNINNPTNNSDYLRLSTPKISVFDPDGKIPLNLKRNELTSDFHPLSSEIFLDTCRNFIVFALIHGPKGPLLLSDNFSKYTSPKHPGLDRRNYYTPKIGLFFETIEGFGISDAWAISKHTNKKGFIIYKQSIFTSNKDIFAESRNEFSFFIGNNSSGNLGEFDKWHRSIAQITKKIEVIESFKGLNISGIRSLMTNGSYSRFISEQKQFITRPINVESKKNNYSIWSIGCDNSDDNTLFKIYSNLMEQGIQFNSIFELYFGENLASPAPGELAKIWKDVIGSSIIPFDMKKRNEIIGTLDKKFERHIDHWRNVKI